MKRSDSAHVMTEITNDAQKGINPPACVTLEEKDLPFWKYITDARAEWTDIDLIHASNLARCLCGIEENQSLLRIEGDVLKNDRGTPVMNPRFTVLEQLSRRAVALSAKIQVHAAATIGEAKLGRAKNSAKREALHAIEGQEDDDLIARPVH